MCRAPIECAEKTGLQREVETPNITGDFRSFDVGNVEGAVGAFYVVRENQKAGATGTTCGTDYIVGIDPSRQNSLYSGESFQPKSLLVLACIRI